MRRSLGVLIGLIACTSVGVGTANATVLVDQSGPPQANGYSRSDTYDQPSDPSLDIKAADDFTVPAGQTWTISQVTAFGAWELANDDHGQPSPPPPDLNVTIYANQVLGQPGFEQDYPGAVVYDPGVALPATGGPNYTIAIPNAPALSPGRYWISVQQTHAEYYNNDFQFTQQWFWQEIPWLGGDDDVVEIQTAVPNGCEEESGTAWNPAYCDNAEPDDSGPNAFPQPRGGPPPVSARMLIIGSNGTGSAGGGGNSSGGTTLATKKTCKKPRVLRHGKCVKRKPKAKKVNPGFTG